MVGSLRSIRRISALAIEISVTPRSHIEVEATAVTRAATEFSSIEKLMINSDHRKQLVNIEGTIATIRQDRSASKQIIHLKNEEDLELQIIMGENINVPDELEAGMVFYDLFELTQFDKLQNAQTKH